ncbi:MAG: BLUF domain-containing protein [Pseudomonadales bacterium]
MNDPCYRLVYVSDSLLQGELSRLTLEVEKILAASQRNNSKRDVTGALIFNSKKFGQVLEGPLSKVESAFESIQLDRRHHNVIVLSFEPTTQRTFSGWSMAYAGGDSATQKRFDALCEMPAQDSNALLAEEVYALLCQCVPEHSAAS